MTEDHDEIIRHDERLGVLEKHKEVTDADKKKGFWAIVVLLGNAAFDRFMGGS